MSKILLGSGTWFDFLTPHESEITIEDVAYGLAFVCRFAGQARHPITGKRLFYSVAEHCVRMCEIAPSQYAYHALMHEVAECVCGDMSSPLKGLCTDFKSMEKACESALLNRFGVLDRDAALIKKLDFVMLATERRDLMFWDGAGWDLPGDPIPLENPITPWSAEMAADAFLKKYAILRPSPHLNSDAARNLMIG